MIAGLGIYNCRSLQVALIFTALECALGLALILGVFPSEIIPFSVMLLNILAFLAYWGTSTGRTEDCGCYNGWLNVTPIQSIFLNLVYIALLVFAAFHKNKQPTVLWQWLVVLATLVTSGTLASGSLESGLWTKKLEKSRQQ